MTPFLVASGAFRSADPDPSRRFSSAEVPDMVPNVAGAI